MLDLNKMIDSAHECIGWPYESPGTNDKNGIDCSGMFVKMYREQGAKIYHGSNTIFREYCSETGKITSAKDLQVGMAVFKCKPWTDADKGNKWYGTEPGNLSHIGFVTSVNPLEITHCTSPVAKTDSSIGKWAYWGKLKDVDYGGSPSPEPGPDPEPTPVTKTMYVTTPDGKSANIRRKASKQAALVEHVPYGASVTWTKNNGKGWAYVKYHGFVGWMMEDFLTEDVPGPAPSPEPDPEPVPDPDPPILIEDATVWSENGKPVHMRAQPTTSCKLYDDVPVGAMVCVDAYNCVTDSKGNQWTKVSYGRRKGWYIMTKFLSLG